MLFFLDFCWAASAIILDSKRADYLVLVLLLEKLLTISRISSWKRLSNAPSVASINRSPSLTRS